jgi:polyhydroxyalkanoate synthase
MATDNPSQRTTKKTQPERPKPKPLAELHMMSPQDVAELTQNMSAVFEHGRAVWEQMIEHQAREQGPINLDPFNTSGAFAELWRSMLSNPEQIAEKTLKFWQAQSEIWHRATIKATGGDAKPVIAQDPSDKRFKDPDWSQNALFDTLKQSYLLLSSYMMEAAQNADDLDERDQKKVAFFTRQFVEAISPTNYFATNPEVLRTTLEQKGENLVRGMRFLTEDMERGGGQLLIRQTDLEKFKLGENMATTPGKVIFRNDVMELIQYEPSTPNVEKRPVLICPPWINKYYILDLNEKKSMVKWLVSQGHTVFMISWANPDSRHRDKEFVDYIGEGLFDAASRVFDETGSQDLHLASYCVAGTMCATALVYLETQPEHPLHGRFASATFLTAQFEFSDAGELQIFVDDAQLQMIDQAMQSGYLGAPEMQTAFNLLRASDLIWSYMINNYMLGKEPFPFDLLYWNADSTRMPAGVHRYYLETFYRDDSFAKGEMSLGGVPLNLGKVSIPTYHVATKEDHIAPPDSVYRGVRMIGGDKKYVLAGSGHIAGVVNPPAGGKYQYWTRSDGAFPETLTDWRDSAEETPGSWWADWDAWMKSMNDAPPVHARKPGHKHNAICDAPGEYVRVRFDDDLSR